MSIRVADISAVIPDYEKLQAANDAFWKLRSDKPQVKEALDIKFDSMSPQNSFGVAYMVDCTLVFSGVHDLHLIENFLILAGSITAETFAWVEPFVDFSQDELDSSGIALIALPYHPGQRVTGKMVIPTGSHAHDAPNDIYSLPLSWIRKIAQQGVMQ